MCSTITVFGPFGRFVRTGKEGRPNFIEVLNTTTCLKGGKLVLLNASMYTLNVCEGFYDNEPILHLICRITVWSLVRLTLRYRQKILESNM